MSHVDDATGRCVFVDASLGEPLPLFYTKKRHPYERDDAYARGSTLLPSDTYVSDEALGRLTYRLTLADYPR